MEKILSDLQQEAKRFFEIFGKVLSAAEMRDLMKKQGVKYDVGELHESGELRKYIKKITFVKHIPFIRMAAICNAAAMGTMTDESDIDLFFIVQGGRIFTARFLTTAIFHLVGIRRHGKKIRGRYCLTFFLSGSSMNLENIRIENDIYMKYWILTLKPFYGFKTYGQFMEANNYIADTVDDEKPSAVKIILENLLAGKVGNFIESFFRNWQLARFNKNKDSLGKKASVIVSDEMLKFHNVDMREYYRSEYEKRCYLAE